MNSPLHRAQPIDPQSVDRAGRTIRLSLSSEAPYERHFGIEVLVHESSAIDLTRIGDGRHPLLINHDWDRQAGVLQGVEIGADKVLRTIAKVSRNPLGEELLNDAEDGIRTLASIGYEILEADVTERDAAGDLQTRRMSGADFSVEMQRRHGDLWHRAGSSRAVGSGDPPLVRVTRWRPFEGSVVSIPADAGVGIGRMAGHSTPSPITPSNISETRTMTTATIEQPAAPALNLSHDADAVRKAERQRGAEIRNIGEEFKRFGGVEAANKALDDGTDVQSFRNLMANAITAAQKTQVTNLDLSGKDTQRFSVMRAIRAMVDRNWQSAGFEKACSDEICKRAGIQEPVNGGFYVPMDVMAKRDLTVAAPTGGGNIVATNLQPQNFIDLLRARSVLARLGATMLPGLVGNVAIPKLTGAATAYWLANEATAITESQQTVGQLALTPKTVGAYTEISRLLMLQSTPAADALVMQDFAKVIALAVDLAGLEGSGASGQPTGISGTAGIGSVTGTSLAYAGVIEFQTDTAAGNALATNSAYVTTPTVAGLLMGRQRFASTDTPLWVGSVLDGQMGGFAATTTTQVTAASMVFGDFSQVVIGEWGMFELAMNPYANFPAGITGIRAMQSLDIGIRQAAAFSRATSIT